MSDRQFRPKEQGGYVGPKNIKPPTNQQKPQLTPKKRRLLRPWMAKWVQTRDIDVVPRTVWPSHVMDSAIEASADRAVAAAISAVLNQEER